MIKKTLILLTSSIFLLAVTACSNNDNDKGQESTEAQEDQGDVEEEVEEKDAEESDSNESEKVDEDQTNSIPEEIASFEEAELLAEHIDFSTTEPEIETDNPNKRVILYNDINDKTKKYKSIFIKKEKRLKIINLIDDGLIYNEVISIS